MHFHRFSRGLFCHEHRSPQGAACSGCARRRRRHLPRVALLAVALFGLALSPLALADVGDMDGDGIIDAEDACPEAPEDLDGFEDEDGCPELDNDGDGVPDIDDRCPLEPEIINGFEDGDGCHDDPPRPVERE